MDCKFLCKREKKKSGVENPDVFQPLFLCISAYGAKRGHCEYNEAISKTNLASSAKQIHRFKNQ